MSNYKFLNISGLKYVWGKIKNSLNTKQDKKDGYSLVSDDEIARLENVDNYNDAPLRSDLEALDTSALKGVKVNDAPTPVADNTAHITIPTNVSDLTNDENYVTKSQLDSQYGDVVFNDDVYSKAEIDAKIKGGVRYKGDIATYADLPDNPANGDLYNILAADPHNGIRAGDNVIWSAENGEWDNLGGVVDLSDCLSKNNYITNDEIDSVLI